MEVVEEQDLEVELVEAMAGTEPGLGIARTVEKAKALLQESLETQAENYTLVVADLVMGGARAPVAAELQNTQVK